jgi:hypothetical protein
MNEREALTFWRVHGEAYVRTRQKNERVMATYFLECVRCKEQVRRRKEREPARNTHFLESASGEDK